MKADDLTELSGAASRPARVTRLGFGGAPLGNLYRTVSEEDAAAAVQAAYDLGLRYVDTAPQYGLGLSEARIGAALARIGDPAMRVSTKIGRLLIDCAPDEVTPEAFVEVPQKRIQFDYSYDGVMRSFESSRQRLGDAQIDTVLIHDICPTTHGSVAASDAHLKALFDGGGYRALSELKSAGDIAAIGAGANEWEICDRLLDLGDFDAFLLAGRYTLLEQAALDRLLPRCAARDVGVILGGPYNSGILATGPVPGARFNYAPAPAEILDRVAKIEAVCAAHGVALIAAALQFPLHHSAVKTVIPGAANAAEVTANVDLVSRPIPTALWSDLKAQNLIRADAPTP